ncbi:hypothetical protein Q3G72_004577 [Acer saccharum]|nr:hypothetical protein Q3G72_004577 [Acer saccharum]
MPTFERFRELLVQRKLVDAAALNALVAECAWTPMRLPWLLVERNLLPELTALQLVSEVCGVPGVDVHKVPYSPAAAAKIPLAVAQRYTLFPMALQGHQLHLAMADPDNMSVRDELSFGSGCDILPYAALAGRITDHLESTYAAADAVAKHATHGASSSIVTGVSLPVVASSAKVAPVLNLPIEPAAAMAQSMAQAPAVEPPPAQNIIVRPGSARTILVVEDEAISRELILKALAPTGCTLVAASDGLTGLNMVREREPVLVVLDAMLPQVHGFEICRKIKTSKRFAKTQVLMVSATYKGWQTAAAIKKTYGADEFLQKPFSMADMRQIVERLMPATEMRTPAAAPPPAHVATSHVAPPPAAAATVKTEHTPPPSMAAPTPTPAPVASNRASLLQGLDHLKGGNVDAALASLQAAERQDPFSAEVQHAIGKCHEVGNQPFRAIYHHERAIELSPGMFGALHSLAQLYQAEGFLNKSRDYWRRAAQNASSPEMQRIIRAHLGDAALQRQVVQGAGLDTNLLELGHITEAQMLAALGRAFALPWADKASIDASPATLTQSFPLMFAETYHLVPHRLEGETLHVLVQQPLDVKLAQRIFERLHLHLVAHITCEVRLHYAMHRLYGMQLLPRFVTLLAQLDGPEPAPQTSAHTQAAEQTRLGWGVSNARVTAVRAENSQGLTRHDVRSQVARLDAAQDRDTIVDIVLGFALALFDFAGLFVVQGGRVQGWRGVDPESTRALSRFDIALKTPSVFHTVARTRGHYLGPIGDQPGNQALLAQLARPTPQVALVAPIVVGGKVAAILYADNQARVIGPKKVAALLVLVQRCGLCFEQLIRRRKLAQAQLQDAPKPPQKASGQSSAEQAAATQLVTDLSSDSPEAAFGAVADPDAALPQAPDDEAAFDAAADAIAPEHTAVASDTRSLQTASDAAPKPSQTRASDSPKTSVAAVARPEPGAAEAPEDELAPDVAIDAAPAQAQTTAASPAQSPLAPPSTDHASTQSGATIGWQDVIDEARRAQSLTPERFSAITVMDTAVDRRDLLFDGLEADDPAARQSAVAGLLALGSSIDAQLSERFPGPLALDPLHTLPRELPPFARLNGLTELIAARGQDAAALVLPHLDSEDAVHRWAAVYYLSCVHYPQACEALARRLYDTEPRIRTLAVDALTHYRAEAAYQRIISGLREQLRVPVVETQIAAIQILGQLREPSAVPALIPLVVTPNALVARSAASALAVVCGQAYGSDLTSWQSWWQSNYTRPRSHWLMGGLQHANSTIRRVAHGELQRLTGQSIAFKSDASADEQARLLQAWQSSLLPFDAP